MTTHVTSFSFPLVIALAAVLVASGCTAGTAGTPSDRPADSLATPGSAAHDSGAESGVRTTVASFGARMQTVSLMAADSIVVPRLRAAYGDLVAPELLDRWASRPTAAPGRLVSSPWPDSIHVRSLRASGDGGFDVAGDLVYATSADHAPGRTGAVTAPVRLHLSPAADGSWRITSYEEGAGGTEGARRAGGGEGADSATGSGGGPPAPATGG